jgi:hypothetical protein
MKVIKSNSLDVKNEINTYINQIDRKNEDKKLRKSFDEAIRVFTNLIEFDTISIECTELDVDFLLYDYIKTLSEKHHLAIFSFVDKAVSVDAVNKIKRICKLSEFYHITPTGFYDDKIIIHIGYFSCNAGEKYDVDLIARTLLDK